MARRHSRTARRGDRRSRARRGTANAFREGTRERGRLAQLGERLLYTEDVGGSSPSSPTISHATQGGL
uniref:Uncharacterized protein n=1 Tax=mine drainage metagenome TaxID=410659 RepID=E6PCJ2_9ZZZZ